eukprot:4438735-Pyramimonas_sp.AAC.1
MRRPLKSGREWVRRARARARILRGGALRTPSGPPPGPYLDPLEAPSSVRDGPGMISGMRLRGDWK